MANNTTFGGPTFHSEVEFNIGISEDKKAFTATFGGLGSLGLGVSLGPGSPPIVTRVFSFALPLSGADPGMEIPFFVSGFVASEEGANGHLLFSVNDQSMVVDFPKNSGNDFVQQFNYKVGSASELRISVFLLADRDSKSGAGVNMNVLAIDTDTAKHQTGTSGID